MALVETGCEQSRLVFKEALTVSAVGALFSMQILSLILTVKSTHIWLDFTQSRGLLSEHGKGKKKRLFLEVRAVRL